MMLIGFASLGFAFRHSARSACRYFSTDLGFMAYRRTKKSAAV
jgi:hypothetical protein